ncbi:MAG: homoserine dehydrogenase [Clostridiales bacterium]|nr:homoserine dehydrogenase [Clostridiales bacterium]MDD7036181.1 homoserine dehydrogenase [Bacillota bacterium]MDY2920754.1 homoserine dehydrogenase [Lentihominibacter sp.]
MKEFKIGLLGLGNIGVGTYKTLEMNKDAIEAELGASVNIVKILEKDTERERDIKVTKDQFVSDIEDITGDPDIDIVIELLGGIEPASTFMEKALLAGKHVVTANKAALAASWQRLHEAEKKGGAILRYEASVGGGIPVLTALAGSLRANRFEEVMGIVNGTTNYILYNMTAKGLDYDTVLKDAQARGFAEADPTADVEGIDAANKLSILMALMFDKYVPPTEIPTEGIKSITAEDIEAADKEGCVIKLIARAARTDDGVEYAVKPMRIEKSHPLAGVDGEFNAVFVRGNAVGELMFYGPGAGPLPTGSAVMGDVMEICKWISK